MHLFLLRCKKICLSVLLTNQINSLDNGFTVRTPFQILVNYICNKIINSNKQNGFQSNPRRSTATLHCLVSYTTAIIQSAMSRRNCTWSSLWIPHWTNGRELQPRRHENTQISRDWWQLHSHRKGHKRWLRPSPKGSRHRGRGPQLT